MKKVFISILAIIFGISLLKAQSEIDYKPKLLLKELASMNGQSQPILSEIDLTNAQANQVYNGKFFRIGDHVSPDKNRYVYIGRVNSCRSGGCSGKMDRISDQTSEYFDYYILFDARCIVSLVKVYNYQATHGQEISATAWLKQFIGYGSEKALNMGKNIDAISGATISVTAITYDIQDKTRMLKQIVQESRLAN
jgi:hypothetical protein